MPAPPLVAGIDAGRGVVRASMMNDDEREERGGTRAAAGSAGSGHGSGQHYFTILAALM
jgi:hypothetical protein